MKEDSGSLALSLWEGNFDIDGAMKNSADTQLKMPFNFMMIYVYSSNSAIFVGDGYIIPPTKLDCAVKLCDQGGTTNHDCAFHY